MRYREINEASLKLLPNDLPRIRGSYGAFIITMDPLDFLKLTAGPEDFERIKERNFPHDQDAYVAAGGSAEAAGRFNIPFLIIEWPSGLVRGHEGRHRAWMIHQQGGTNFPVAIYMRQPNEYSITYEKSTYDEQTEQHIDEPQEEDFGTGYEAARARYAELSDWNTKKRREWTTETPYDPVSYFSVKFHTHRLGDIKGSPTEVNPNDPWDRKPYKVSDMPKQLRGQYDDSVVVDKYRVGLVKGYSHFR